MPYFLNKGRKLYYYTYGHGTPLFFIHGYLGSSRKHWQCQLQDKKLSSKFQLMAYDVRGFGLSSVKMYEAPTTNQILSDTYVLLNKVLNIDDPLIMVGYSVGAVLALTYTLLFPKRVKAIVLLSPIPYMFSRIQSYNFPRSGTKQISKELNTLSILTDKLWKIVKKRNREHILKITNQLAKNPNKLLIQIQKLNIPILMIYGIYDTVVPQEAFYLLEKHLPKHSDVKRLVADHGISHEHPNLFNLLLLNFCRKY